MIVYMNQNRNICKCTQVNLKSNFIGGVIRKSIVKTTLWTLMKLCNLGFYVKSNQPSQLNLHYIDLT